MDKVTPKSDLFKANLDRVAPLLTAEEIISASQKPIRDSSSIPNAVEISAGVVSAHQIA